MGRQSRITFLSLAAAWAAFAGGMGQATAQECASPAAEWVFCDDFESPMDVDGNLGLWDDQGLHPSNLVLTTDPTRVHSGTRALEITATMGADTGGGPAKWFPALDEMYVRFWVQFEESYNYPHHLVTLMANSSADMWSAFGMAGCRPAGDNFFTTAIEPWNNWGAIPPPGTWNFYTYSMDMTCDSGANCANYADPMAICDQCGLRGSPCTMGLECCWGNSFAPATNAISNLGEYHCIEMMAAVNTPGVADGMQAFWMDGVMAGSWGGIEWRSDPTLAWNAIGLWHYVTDGVYAPGQTSQTIWFDDVVVSSAPIGCGVGMPPPPGSDAGPPPGSDSGTGGSDAGSGTDSSTGGSDAGSGGGGDGCSCGVMATASPVPAGSVGVSSLVLLVLVLRRRRRSR